MARVGRMVKESIVREISEELSQRPNVFVTGINRLPASGADALRQKLFASRAHLLVVKQRLGLRAMEPLKISGLAQLLEGSVGLVLVEGDALPTAKVLVEFHKAHEDGLSVRGAVIDGCLLDAGQVEQLATLPPRPLLLAQVIATVESPIADVIFTIEQLIGDVAWIVEHAAEKKPTTEAGTPPKFVGGVAEGSPEDGVRGTTTTTAEPTKEGT